MAAAVASFVATTALTVAPGSSCAYAATAGEGSRRLAEAQALYQSGQYFKAARYAFAAAEEDPSRQAEAYSWVTLSLVRARLYNAASFFFVKTLQSGNKAATRRVLSETQELLVRVGGDLLRKYMIRHTTYDDYDSLNRSAYLYALGKDALLKGDAQRAIGYLNGIDRRSALWPFALQVRATAYVLAGKQDLAINDFQSCAEEANSYVSGVSSNGRGDDGRVKQRRREADDLRARCLAGESRVLYEQERFADADRAYDRIPKASFVWPDILFEQAWNSFGRQEYNRTLGKLVSYRSPALSFVFIPEADVLKAQAYLGLCLYSDANEVINEFNSKYAAVGEEVKRFVEKNQHDLTAFYAAGASALKAPLHTRNDFHRMMNRFVRGPYFQNLVDAEAAIQSEVGAVRTFASMHSGAQNEPGRGFPGFLNQVLAWRVKTVKLLGGAFVKNSLMDYHSALISDFEKMAFIKLEMLSRAKDRLIYKKANASERNRGNVEPSRRDDQYKWSFNGEFWNDELGDYVFGLESECQK